MKMKLMLITGLMLAAVGCSSVVPEKAPEPEVQQVTVVENPSSKEVIAVPAQPVQEVPTATVPAPVTDTLDTNKEKVPGF